MVDTVIVQNNNRGLFWFVLTVIFFILFIIFLAYTIYYASRDNIVDTNQQTNFQQPIFSSTQVFYPNTYNGVPASNTFDIATAQLAVAASQSVSNLEQNGGGFVPAGQFAISSVATPAMMLTKVNGSISPYDLVVAFPDRNIFTYANNGSWNQVPWFNLGSVNSGIAQIGSPTVNAVESAVKKVPDNGAVLFCGHGAGAGAALMVAMRVQQKHQQKNIITYVSGCPKIGDNVWYNNLSNNNFGFDNIWWLSNSSDNIFDNPLPTMVNSQNGNVFGYTPQVIPGRNRRFTYQTFNPTNNHSMAAYAYALNSSDYKAPYNFVWPFVPIS